MKKIMLVIMVLLISIAFNQNITYSFEPDEPDLSIPKPHYEYSIAWREWEDRGGIAYFSGIQPESRWEYHSRMFEDFEGMLKWLNSSNYYGFYGEQKRIRLNDNQIIAIYDLTRAKKIKLKIVKTEMVEPYKVETKERKWTDVQWEIQ